ncbi:hypothetical protein E4T79_06090 [Streptococcus sp. LYSM12]|nr:hypothetical protein E4T79_06090 [Streptococcus sp. LYSM12]
MSFIVISFILYYFVHSLCPTLVQPATRCLVVKANKKTISGKAREQERTQSIEKATDVPVFTGYNCGYLLVPIS